MMEKNLLMVQLVKVKGVVKESSPKENNKNY